MVNLTRKKATWPLGGAVRHRSDEFSGPQLDKQRGNLIDFLKTQQRGTRDGKKTKFLPKTFRGMQ